MAEPFLKMTNKKDHTLVAVTGEMTVAQASELREGLLKAFEMGKGVEFSLAGVDQVDLTGLQLICSAHRTALLKGVPFTVIGADSGAVSSAAELAGMLRHTGCVQDVNQTCVWKKVL